MKLNEILSKVLVDIPSVVLSLITEYLLVPYVVVIKGGESGSTSGKYSSGHYFLKFKGIKKKNNEFFYQYSCCEKNTIETVEKLKTMEKFRIQPILESSRIKYTVRFHQTEEAIKLKTNGNVNQNFCNRWIPFTIYNVKKNYFMTAYNYDS